MKRSILIVLLAVLLVLSSVPVCAEETPARELSGCGRFQIRSYALLTDHDIETYLELQPDSVYTGSWNWDAYPATVRFEFWDIPGAYTVLFCSKENEVLSELPGKSWFTVDYPIPEGAASVSVVTADVPVRISSWEFWSEGTMPAIPISEMLPTPEKLDYLVVATHFDDDVLFLGAVVPIYGAGQGKTGTILYTASRPRARLVEGLAGAREMGLQYLPLFTRFRDTNKPYYAEDFTEENLLLYLVRTYRRYKPEVVVTQDLNGEYGAWQHIVTSETTQKAVSFAADESFDPESAAEYGTWQVKKLYIHLFPENKITLDVNTPIEALGGRTAFRVACDAYQCHASQVRRGRYSVTNEGLFDLTAFGLAYTDVGPDTPGVNDMFEHIESGD